MKIQEIRNNEVYDGDLLCQKCSTRFPIIRYVPRLITNTQKKNYSDSWGELWKNTALLVRDSSTGDSFYFDSIFGEYSEDNLGKPGTSMFGFCWPQSLKGQRILEIGSGSGCCTEHLIRSGAEIVALDMSNAIDSFPDDLITAPNVNVVQADINSLVLKPEQFDRIWMFQVLQHTPRPDKTLEYIYPLLTKGGELAFTSYKDSFYPWWWRITRNRSYRFVRRLCSLFLPIKLASLHFADFIGSPILKSAINRLMRFVDPRNIYYKTINNLQKDGPTGRLWEKSKDKKQLFELTVLNTFDCITPEYTNGASHSQIRLWSEQAGFKSIQTWGKAGVRARAFRLN